jgi:hypothetical protein
MAHQRASAKRRRHSGAGRAANAHRFVWKYFTTYNVNTTYNINSTNHNNNHHNNYLYLS